MDAIERRAPAVFFAAVAVTAVTFWSHSAAGDSDVDVRASSEVASYADTNHVYVTTPSLGAKADNPTAGWTVGGRYLVDVVSAASPDIISTASRRWEEVRHAGNVDASYKPGLFGVSATGNVSHEPDYDSITGGASLTQDLAQRNVTLVLGYSKRHDVIGRTGTPFSVFSHTLDIDGIKGGITVVLDRATVFTLVGDVMFERGDPSKPYRYIPLFAPGTQVARGASVDEVNKLRLSARVLEQLPLMRNRYAVAGRASHRFEHATLRLDERVYTDSWGLVASTTDSRLLFDVGSRLEVGPHVRFHGQTPVDFWQRAYTLRPGFDFPALRTGERELGPLIGITAGATARLRLGKFTLGLDLNVTQTRYLDDLYVEQRLSGLAALSLEVSF